MVKEYHSMSLLKLLQNELNKALFLQDIEETMNYLRNKIKILEEERMSPNLTYGEMAVDSAKEKDPRKELKLNVEVNIEIKDDHILAEFGCVKHICHNLQELTAFAKQELLKEMPILKDFGKAKKESSKRPIRKKASDETKAK